MTRSYLHVRPNLAALVLTMILSGCVDSAVTDPALGSFQAALRRRLRLLKLSL